MSAWWLAAIVPASFYAGFVWSNVRWVRASRRKALVPDPYRATALEQGAGDE